MTAPNEDGRGDAAGEEAGRDRAWRHTRTGSTWAAIAVAVVVLVFLLVFIVQNLNEVTIHFLGVAGTLPLGIGMLFAALAGALLVVLVGTARILQLSRAARGPRRKHRKSDFPDNSV